MTSRGAAIDLEHGAFGTVIKASAYRKQEAYSRYITCCKHKRVETADTHTSRLNQSEKMRYTNEARRMTWMKENARQSKTFGRFV